MPEQLQKILDKILEWWKKFNNKQRVMLISVIGVVIIALVILALVMSTPTMTTLCICDDYKEAAQIKELLDADGSIKYETTGDGLVFRVDQKDEAAACMLLGANEIFAESFSIDEVLSGGMTATEADKQKRYKEFLEAKFAAQISTLDIVKECSVTIDMPENDGTIIARDEQAKAAVSVDLAKEIDSEQAAALAQYVATMLGNDSTEGVTIIDYSSRIIYSGADTGSGIGAVSTQLSYMQKLESSVKDEIAQILVGSKIFANVEVAANLDVDFSQTVTNKKELGIPDGMTGGALLTEHLYSYESTLGTTEGVPGTDTNDDTTYVFQDGQNGYTVIDESDKEFGYNETLQTITNNGGNIKYDNCSITVVATRHITYDEYILRTTGQLEDMSFEEFRAANSGTRVIAADDMYIEMIANATGFSQDRITFVCYEEPVFIAEPDDGRSLADYGQILIAVLIFVLLGYVVFRSTRAAKQVEIEPELSVETLLEATAPAEQLEDIGYNEKSEVRVMIEKFVDENPDAVAQLLRNWLNEEWG